MSKEDKKLLRLDVTQATLAAMTILLVLMTACLVSLRVRVVELEREIQAVEQRAMERESRLILERAGAETRHYKWAKTAAETVETDCRVAALLAMTKEEEPILCSAEEDPVILDTETAMSPWPENETNYVLRVLTAEAGTDEVLCGCAAQALYNACERYGWAYSPAEMMVKYRYTDPASWVSAEAEKAWDEVFMSGVTWDCVGKATVFYAPRYGESAYHESQRFVTEINGVRFFEEVQG